MVVFTCSACGESVKKGQVEKHVNKCWDCQCLSCMDCGRDFWGEDYKSHVKCISEDQKYGGKGHEAKLHKGDVKQQEWIQKVHEAIKETSINPKVRDILEQMYAYDNIPRKKQKFQNWMTNSLKIHNMALQDQVWNIFSEATRKETVENQSAKSEVMPTPLDDADEGTEKVTKLKRKREPKEERETRKKKKKEASLELKQESSELLKGKKSKREKQEEMAAKKSGSSYLQMTKQKQTIYPAELEAHGNGLDIKERKAKANKKKCKRNLSESGSPIVEKNQNSSEIEENEDERRDNYKFSWKGTIKTVLKQVPDNEISIKKLRKKVLAQYYAVAEDHHKSEVEILALFNKKISNNPKFRILKEKVKLLK